MRSDSVVWACGRRGPARVGSVGQQDSRAPPAPLDTRGLVAGQRTFQRPASRLGAAAARRGRRTRDLARCRRERKVRVVGSREERGGLQRWRRRRCTSSGCVDADGWSPRRVGYVRELGQQVSDDPAGRPPPCLGSGGCDRVGLPRWEGGGAYSQPASPRGTRGFGVDGGLKTRVEERGILSKHCPGSLGGHGSENQR